MISSLLLSAVAFGQYQMNDIVVSSKTGSTKEQMTQSVSTLSGDQLIGSQNQATQSLNRLSGVNISRNGLMGAQASAFIRGGESRHTLVLINGVRVNDPSDPNRGFDLSYINNNDIEKIEVIKGPAAQLYGSDAIAGVINIITKKTSKNYVELGGGLGKEVTASAGKVYDNSYFRINGNYNEFLIGSMAADPSGDDNFENDGSITRGLDMHAGYSTDKHKIDVSHKFVEGETDVDAGPFNDSDSQISELSQQVSSVKYSMNYNDSTKLNYTLGRYESKRNNRTQFPSERYASSYQHDLNLLKQLDRNKKLLIGFSLDDELTALNGDDVVSQEQTALYSQFDYSRGRNLFNFGFRRNQHTQVDEITTFNVGLSRKMRGNQRVAFNHGTGFKAPSLDQLYGQFGANEDLGYETSRSTEISYSKAWGIHTLEVALFYNEVNSLIGYTTEYVNQDSFITRGVEATFTAYKEGRIQADMGVNLAHYSNSTDGEVLRRPSHKLNLNSIYSISDKWQLSANWIWEGRRFDTGGFGQPDEVMKAYDKLDLALLKRDQGLEWQVGVENVFDREYELVRGYSTLGATLFARARYNF